MNEFKIINECGQVASSPADSKGKPVVLPTTYNINVRFATLSPVAVPIRQQIQLPVSDQSSVSEVPVWLMTWLSTATPGNL